MPKMNKDYMVRNCLHNLSLRENNNKNITLYQKQYYSGMFVMAVSAYVDNGMLFDKAFQKVVDLLPSDHIDLNLILPESWKEFI
jgi:AAA+ superfamily predicted ATPase